MTTAQGVQIMRAISELSRVQSSVSENIFKWSGFTANNSGYGTQTNHYARGEHGAQGSSRQYDSAGGAINFGKDCSE
jgi:hypothetical protein